MTPRILKYLQVFRCSTLDLWFFLEFRLRFETFTEDFRSAFLEFFSNAFLKNIYNPPPPSPSQKPRKIGNKIEKLPFEELNSNWSIF